MRTNIDTILNNNQNALNAIPWDKLTNAWIGEGFALGLTNMPDYRARPAIFLGKMLYLQAIVESDSGDGSKAVANLRRGLALFHTFRSAVLVHHLIRRTGESLCCQVLERVMSRVEISADDLTALEHLLSDDHRDGFREAFMEIRCRNIYGMTLVPSLPNSAWAVSNAFESKMEAGLKTQIFATYFRLSGKMYSNTDFLEMLDVRSAQIAALKLPPKERFAEFTRLKNQVASQGTPTYMSQFNGAALDLSRQLQSDAEVLAKLQISRVALEVERWRLAHGGRAPDSLAELVPDFAPSIPLDPFDNQPLRYKKLARGFLVYSIGADFTDDGGKEKTGDKASDDSDSDHYDITFSVER
jgi:hypothetical protein